MAVLWQSSLVPWIDESGDPYAGALAYFFDVGTTTPQITYTDATLSIPHDHPVEANSGGMFPPIFLPDESSHRIRITDAVGVTIWDVDNISVPTTTPPDFPTSDTPVEQRWQTGHILIAWRASAPTGFVRLNGRTIGAAASGATERANADAQALFILLWDNDPNLAVSGGRGGTSAGDWAANKTIALPDFRGRVPGGLDSMGSSAAGRITDAVLGADSDLLGAAGGAQTHTLTTAQLAAHGHTVTVTDPGHRHFTVATGGAQVALTNLNQVRDDGDTGVGDAHYTLLGTSVDATIGRSSSATTGITAAANNNGSGEAHNNLQPTIIVPFFIKL